MLIGGGDRLLLTSLPEFPVIKAIYRETSICIDLHERKAPI